METNSSNAVLASCVLGNGQIISQTRGGNTNYSLADVQGSTRALTNTATAITATYRCPSLG